MIVLLEESRFEPFFTYLHRQLSDNGKPGHALFQPAPLGEGLTDAFRSRFIKSLLTPRGEPGWRMAWVMLSDEGEISGHVDLRPYSSPLSSHRLLLGMGVHPAHRRQGTGTRLLEHALCWCREQPAFDYIDLQVLDTNHPAIAMYEKAGFSRTGLTQDFFRIEGHTAGNLTMTLEIRA